MFTVKGLAKINIPLKQLSNKLFILFFKNLVDHAPVYPEPCLSLGDRLVSSVFSAVG